MMLLKADADNTKSLTIVNRLKAGNWLCSGLLLLTIFLSLILNGLK